jgi:hypothetical protein
MSARAFDPKRDHRISREEAACLVHNFQVHAKKESHRASAFARGAFEQLLAQHGAAGIRIYRAKHKDGAPTMVMVAVDAKGVDLDGPEAICIQNGADCPPVCGGTLLAKRR